MMVPRDGMQSLVTSLSEALKDDIILHSSIQSLSELKSPNIILTTPTQSLASLIESADPVSANLLRAVSYSPLVTVTVHYHRSHFRKAPPSGVGVLIPRNEGFRILGVLFNSSAFNNRVQSKDYVSMTVMLGGTTDPEALQLTDSAVQAIINDELERLIGTTQNLTHLCRTNWSHAIPIYSLALAQAQKSLKEGFCSKPGLVVFNNYSKDVSIRGMIETLIKD